MDDGITSGATAAAAIASARLGGAKRVIVAAPVAATAGVEMLRTADEVIVPLLLKDLVAVSTAYTDFRQLTDDDLRALLAEP